MSYIGKEFKVDTQENFDKLIESIDIPEDYKKAAINHKSTLKLLKDGDTYTLISSKPDGTFSELKFKDGVEFDQDFQVKDYKGKSTINVNGNVFTQVVKFVNGATVEVIREFSDNAVNVTIKSSIFNGVAKRFYKAV